jgi:uncharacterized OsmC-like protein
MERAMTPGPFRVDVQQRDHFQFDVVFDDGAWSPIVVDEPAPLGEGAGPNAARLLAGAVGNCLAASLLLCMEKSRVPVLDLRAHVEGTMTKNEAGRYRIERLDVTIVPTVEGDPSSKRFGRCLDIFEDFCIVTQSVRDGIDVGVRVEPRSVGMGAGDGPESEGELVGARG